MTLLNEPVGCGAGGAGRRRAHEAPRRRVSRTTRGLFVVLVLSLLQACTTLVPTPAGRAGDDAAGARAAWARVLERFVDDDGQVDFAALRG
ncbi:MAG: hypothetical protein MUF30_02380, partial [Burkholderiales bacterium]|nr:hypothetical protein [Burkholderiales bacterium]